MVTFVHDMCISMTRILFDRIPINFSKNNMNLLDSTLQIWSNLLKET